MKVKFVKCNDCNGLGTKFFMMGIFPTRIVCNKCHGRGQVVKP